MAGSLALRCRSEAAKVDHSVDPCKAVAAQEDAQSSQLGRKARAKMTSSTVPGCAASSWHHRGRACAETWRT